MYNEYMSGVSIDTIRNGMSTLIGKTVSFFKEDKPYTGTVISDKATPDSPDADWIVQLHDGTFMDVGSIEITEIKEHLEP